MTETQLLEKSFNKIKHELRETCLDIDHNQGLAFRYMKDLLLYCKEVVMLMQYRKHIQGKQEILQNCLINGHFYKELTGDVKCQKN